MPAGRAKPRAPRPRCRFSEGITSKLLMLPEDTFVLPGHGQGASIGAARRLYRHWVEQYPTCCRLYRRLRGLLDRSLP